MGGRDIPEGVRGWGRTSRRKPPGRFALAGSAHGLKRHSGQPGPPGDVNTARHATDTWPGVPIRRASISSPDRANHGGGTGERSGIRQAPG